MTDTGAEAFRFELVPFEQLTLHQFHDLAVLRNDVFVVGQQITAEPELDGHDPEYHHALFYRGEELVGTARVKLGVSPCKVGRVAITRTLQRSGLGTMMMRRIQAHLGSRPALLHAQAHLEAWYASLGWVREGALFVEADIPHVTMRWNPRTCDD